MTALSPSTKADLSQIERLDDQLTVNDGSKLALMLVIYLNHILGWNSLEGH